MIGKRWLVLLALAFPVLGQQHDLLLKGGHLIDPKNDIDAPMDVAVREGKISAVAPNIDASTARRTLDVSGLYVTPGLVDVHVHVYHSPNIKDAWAGDNSVQPDAFSFRTGTTTMVDAGSSGWRNFEHFRFSVIDRVRTRVLAMINIAGFGMMTDFVEQGDFDADAVAALARKHKDVVVGVKSAHYQKPGWESVDQAIAAGKAAGIPIMVDFGYFLPERPYWQLVTERLRPGDISTHMFRGPVPYVDKDGKLYEYLKRARERGVRFDVGHGGGSFAMRNAVPAIQQGFYPDTISTDLHSGSMNAGMMDMPSTMSKLLVMGMPLKEVVRASTWTPAQTIHREDLGHLSVGAVADIAVFQRMKGTFGYVDAYGARFEGRERLFCELTVSGGRVVWNWNGRGGDDYRKLPPDYGVRPGVDTIVPPPSQTARGNVATTPGEVTTPYPTITNVSIDWKIEGDDNSNGVVEVQYRISGQRQWHRAMPLRRISAGQGRTTQVDFRWENRHSGSIFDLRPNTEYEIALKLHDPDGGSAERTVRVRTRPVPRDPARPRIRKADSETLANIAASANPGDVILLAAGNYGMFAAGRDGAPGNPIVFRSANGAAVFDRVDLRNRKHVHVEGLTVNGSIDLLGGEWLVVRRCTVNAMYGIIANQPPGTSNAYIADNVVTGTMPWESTRMGASPPPGFEGNKGEGIQITGSGNVIAHNRVRGYRDCISFMEDRRAAEQISNDIYNNDISLGLDDAIEADFCMGNCRILRNRITNSFMGLSSQPGLGGPTYFIRNVMYNITNAPFKLARYSSGDVLLHNTAVKVGDGLMAPHRGWSFALLRNNLTIGGKGGGMFGRYHSGPGRAVYLPGPELNSDLDYDGVGAHGVPFEGQIRDVKFKSIEEMRALTQEKHAMQVDMSVFRAEVEFPDPAIPERPIPDLRIRAGSAAVDTGAVLHNVNDRYRGKAPDLGAYEAGDELPIYGPRPAGVDEETQWRR